MITPEQHAVHQKQLAYFQHKTNEMKRLIEQYEAEHPSCDVCGSEDITDSPQMGRNCNDCHPLDKWDKNNSKKVCRNQK